MPGPTCRVLCLPPCLPHDQVSSAPCAQPKSAYAYVSRGSDSSYGHADSCWLRHVVDPVWAQWRSWLLDEQPGRQRAPAPSELSSTKRKPHTDEDAALSLRSPCIPDARGEQPAKRPRHEDALPVYDDEVIDF